MLEKLWQKKNLLNNRLFNCKNMQARLKFSEINFKEPKDRPNKLPLMPSKPLLSILLMRWLEFQDFILKLLVIKQLNCTKLLLLIIYKSDLLIVLDSKTQSIKKFMKD